MCANMRPIATPATRGNRPRCSPARGARGNCGWPQRYQELQPWGGEGPMWPHGSPLWHAVARGPAVLLGMALTTVGQGRRLGLYNWELGSQRET
jgi:hypothetical protein